MSRPDCNHGAKVSTEFHRRAGDAVRPDWVRLTFRDPADVWDAVRACEVAFGEPLLLVERKRGLLGFVWAFDLVGTDGVAVARYATGGDHMRGRSMIEVSGASCERVREWGALVAFAEALDGRLTRLDVCLDTEAVTVAEAVTAWRSGAFAGRGRPPGATLVDDMGSGKGQTFYVGRRGSDTCLRVYEKGKQLGDRASTWVRVELELLAKTTVLPLAAMLDCERLFCGAYRWLADLMGRGGTRPERIKRATVVVLGQALAVARQQVGGLVGYLTRRAGWSVGEVVRFLQRQPSRRILGELPDDEWLSLCRYAQIEPAPEYGCG